MPKDWPQHLLSRIEDAGINASAPPQQRWLDGWLMRFSPGKAKRSRCIYALAEGRSPLGDKLGWAAEAYRESGLPMVVRITPFVQPATLDAQLAALGMARFDDTRVMLCPSLPTDLVAAPPGTRWRQLEGEAFAMAVGELRGSPAMQRQAHAERLRAAPVPHHAVALCREADGAVIACGQMARETELIGLYDVYTHAAERGRGLATAVCSHLLATGASQGSRLAYLQVEADNHGARRIYARLGFTDAYSYHYRSFDSNAA